MIKRSRFVVTIGLVLALACAAVAFADGASENEAAVDGKISPKKLDPKVFKPVKLFTGVRTTGPVTGSQENPEAEMISFGKNLKLKSGAAPTCDAPIEFRTTEEAEAACPNDSRLGDGVADILLADGRSFENVTVTTFNGPANNQIRLHTYHPQLAGATPTVLGRIVKSNAGGKYGQALSVPDAPDVAGDTGKITKFNTTIERQTGVVLARCKAKNFLWQREVTYDDNSKETASLKQKCTQKGNA